MKRLTAVLTLCFVGAAAAAVAQESSSSSGQEVTTQQTTTTQVTLGKVVRYEPGKTIVVTGTDGREVTYVLAPKIEAPADIQVGREVSLSIDPSSGQNVVTRITTQSMTPDGRMKTETQTRSTSPSGETTETTETTITGTVSALEPGKSVTFMLPDQKTVVYTIDASSVVPSDIAVGKTYTVETTVSKRGGRIVKKIVTKTKTSTP